MCDTDDTWYYWEQWKKEFLSPIERDLKYEDYLKRNNGVETVFEVWMRNEKREKPHFTEVGSFIRREVLFPDSNKMCVDDEESKRISGDNGGSVVGSECGGESCKVNEPAKELVFSNEHFGPMEPEGEELVMEQQDMVDDEKVEKFNNDNIEVSSSQASMYSVISDSSKTDQKTDGESVMCTDGWSIIDHYEDSVTAANSAQEPIDYNKLNNDVDEESDEIQEIAEKLNDVGLALPPEDVSEKINYDPRFFFDALIEEDIVEHTSPVASLAEMQFEDFRTNVMRQILNFAKNNSQTELLFDKTLTQSERLEVHHIASLITSSGSMLCGQRYNDDQRSIVNAITKNCSFYFRSGWVGEGPNCHLLLTKCPMKHVFTITPDQLNDIYHLSRSRLLHGKNIKDSAKWRATGYMKRVEMPKHIEYIKEIRLHYTTDYTKAVEVHIIGDGYCDECDGKCKYVTEDDSTGSSSENTSSGTYNEDEEDDEDVEEDVEEYKDVAQYESEEYNDQVSNEDYKNNKHNDVVNFHRLKSILNDFLKEFASVERFTEMRFLGAFNEMESIVILDFINEVKMCINNVDICERVLNDYYIRKVFTSKEYKLVVGVDWNGDEFISKCPR